MQLLVIGVNHSTADIALRERLAFAPESLVERLQQLVVHLSESVQFPVEVAILSTCNRSDIILSHASLDSTGSNSFGTDANRSSTFQQSTLRWLADFSGVDIDQLESHAYAYYDESAVRYLVRVAAGLDSMVLGEPQIFGQIKSAYAVAKEAGTVGVELDPVFQHVFATAKKVRSNTAIGENPVSVAYAAVNLSRRIFADLSMASALLIGAGETIELVARHLRDAGAGTISVANRTLDRAHELASKLSVNAMLLSEVPERLAEFDIVISSTGSQLPVLGKGAVEQAIKIRKHNPMFMVDIAVPRDIEPQVSELPDVYLYSIDDLREVIDQNVRLREAEVDKADEIVNEGVQAFLHWRRSRGADDLVLAYRDSVQQLCEKEIDKAMQLLTAGNSADEVIHQLARSLTNKIMHKPSVEIRNAVAMQDQTMLEAASVLLGIEKKVSDYIKKDSDSK